ncbi:MAG: ImmA/IrrE family metallo-endopeptidase [Gammaproteobacteria bacterium]
MSKGLTPIKAANKLTRIVDAFYEVHGGDRFPVDVDRLAYGVADFFQWSDPITKISDENIPGFEGMLAPNDNKSKWMIAYNSSISSQGRVRFTKAHELGHYVLHRMKQSEFMCSKDDMLYLPDGTDIESEADKFASYLLMPLNDFRAQVKSDINLDVFGHCADRYGVSLTAAILKWLSYTEEKAILIMSNDGFMKWACSSRPAFKSGAFYKTKNNVIELPSGSLAIDDRIGLNKEGLEVPTKTWFKYADSDSDLLEMKMYSEQYDCTLTLLVLPKSVDCWEPR